MAVFRKPPICPHCGNCIQGKFRDESHLPMQMRMFDDTFEGWDFAGHKCPEGTVMKTEQEIANQQLKAIGFDMVKYMKAISTSNLMFDGNKPM